MTAQAEDKQLPFGEKRSGLRVDYSSRATNPGPSYVPPLPGTDGFARVRGRAGDLIIVQLKGMTGETAKRKAALRTLGLGRINSACLRDSSEASIWGNINLVRDIISVVILPRKQYASGVDARSEVSGVEYDSLKYGTDTRPAHLWRDSDGDYFAYEFEKRSLVAFWSSDCDDFREVEDRIAMAGLAIDKGRPEAQLWVKTTNDEKLLHKRIGAWSELLNSIGQAAVGLAVIPLDSGTSVTWRASFRQFHDVDVLRPKITVASRPADVLAIRALAPLTCTEGFLEKVPCRVTVRVDGVIREYPIEPV